MDILWEMIEPWRRALEDVPVALIGISAAAFTIISLCLTGLSVILIPKDYFRGAKPSALPFKTNHPWLNLAMHTFKNVVGVFLVLVGLMLLVLPGQGILTILVGVVFLDFPGKRALELRLVKRPKILRALNWLRTKLGGEPFVL